MRTPASWGSAAAARVHGRIRPASETASGLVANPFPLRRVGMGALCLLLAVALAFFWLVVNGVNRRPGAAEWVKADELDNQLQRAATLALGDRRGTIIVMDPQTGRIRAVVNSELAFAENLPPGSTIKPFTALAALRSGVIDANTRTLCGEQYAHEEFQTTCAHPRGLPPLNPTEAIAYSCNYYFGKVGERLAEPDFNATLTEFGFGKSTGVNAENEAPGLLRHNDWQAQNAIGAGDYLRATPIQVLAAYAALVNGGQLLVPRVAPAADFVPRVRSKVVINPEQRDIILKGMRGAVRYGTAETASLYSLPLLVFGKTGTATEFNGYRSQGWFVGFVSQPDGPANGPDFAPETIKLAVLVFLARAHGSEAAAIARPIFLDYARAQAAGNEDTRRPFNAAGPLAVAPRSRSVVSPSGVQVHLVRENITRSLPLEDYVLGVVAAEGSTEREPEALKALAIASRTYALKNLGRHQPDGYDFCTTTHCQRYRAPGSSAVISPAIVAAVADTRDEVLRDSNGQLAESYFSASCGGATANLATLWGGTAPAYLRGVHDDYCANEPHHDWTDVISEAQLLKALQTDPRTDVGARLDRVSVLQTDATGRAERISIAGTRRVTVGGWDFKIIVGRALGWNLLKSSRFEIVRSGSNYLFRGHGFGHGLGLCQEGAHVMAERGAGYRQILAKYFPSTRVAGGAAADLLWEGNQAAVVELVEFSQVIANLARRARVIDTSLAGGRPGARRSLASENFRISYPGAIPQAEVAGLLTLLESNRRSLLARAAAAGVRAQLPPLEVFLNETTGDFVGRSGQPAWAAAATKGRRIELQPLATLKRRGILETTLRHELVHSLVNVISRERAPRWLAEGLALFLAGEGRMIDRYRPKQRLTTDEIERQLGADNGVGTSAAMRSAYAAAYDEVKRLIDVEGEAKVWGRLTR